MQPPVFEQVFRNARFAQGGNALFEGRITGVPKPVVSWTRKGAPLLGRCQVYPSESSRLMREFIASFILESNKYQMSYNQVTGEVKLLIKNIGAEDEGEYTCSARNLYGEAICSVFIQPEGKNGF